MKERETVMDVVMEVLMMEMKVARETSYAEVITAYSLVFTTMKKMTAARKLREGAQLGWWILRKGASVALLVGLRDGPV